MPKKSTRIRSIFDPVFINIGESEPTGATISKYVIYTILAPGARVDSLKVD